MNRSSVEKILREGAARLPKAEFTLAVPESAQPIPEFPARERKTVRPVFRAAVAALSVVALTCSVCFAASAEFRNTVASLFRAADPEDVVKIPEDDTIRFIGKHSIENIADVSYYYIPGGSSIRNNIVSVTHPDRSIQYYLLENDLAAEIKPVGTRVTDTVEFDGRTLFLDFEYGMLNGESYHLKNIDTGIERDEDTESQAYYFYDDDRVWISASTGSQAAYRAYYLLYNLKTGEVTDILAGVIPENMHIEWIVFSPNRQRLILKEFSWDRSGTRIYFDTVTKKTASFMNFHTCYFINDETLFIKEYHNESNELTEDMLQNDDILSGYCYNLNTGEKFDLFGEDDLVIYSLHGTSIIEKDGVYKIVTFFGKEYTVEGIDLGDGYVFMPNPDHTKIAFLNLSRGGPGLNTSEIGIIDLARQEIKVFERKGYEQNEESAISWNDDTSLAISISGGGFYIYRFK